MSRSKKPNDYKNTFCGNCGNLGHTYKMCHYPITSCGVILFKNNKEKVVNIEDKYRFLLIQRKDTLGFIEFLRGKYKENDIKYITRLIEMILFYSISFDQKKVFIHKYLQMLFDRFHQ